MDIMNFIFKHYLDKFVLVYLRNILIYSENENKHVTHVRETLEILRRYRLFAKISKSTFCANEKEYLSYILKGDGVLINPLKKAIKSWESPTCKRDVQSFLGLVNYYL